MTGTNILFLLCILVLWGVCCAYEPSSHVPITIALKQRNIDQLKDLFWSISDPKSQSYGKYLTVNDLKEYGCDDGTLDIIISWLENEGASNIRVAPTNDYINADVPTKLALLLYKKDSIPASIVRASFEVMDAIDFVIATKSTFYAEFANDPIITHETTASPTFSNKLAAYKNQNTAAEKGTPNNQRAAYGIPANLIGTNSTNTQMVWGPGTYGFLDSDLSAFYKDFQVQASISDAIHLGYLGVPGGDNFGEATLDLQTITGIAPGIKTFVSNTDNSSSTEEGDGFGPAFLQFVIDLNNNPNLPNVLSLSLGSLSFDSCTILCDQAVKISQGSVTLAQCNAYMQQQRQVCMYPNSEQVDRTNIELMKLGTRGVTVVAATGDGGSHFSFQRFPTNETIGRLLNTVSCEYNLPTFPAESPYVLGVGGTQWGRGGSTKPEPWVASGGGFSWRYPILKHQQNVVQQYLQQQKSKLPPASSFNASNRAYPDVAALALDVAMIMQGTTYYAGGTSASTPATGGIISLINDERLNKGLPPLGFIAPRLYQIAAQYPGEAFFDMTTGSSACDSNGFCCSTGFPAAPGWDATTGLGSPIWAGLYKYLSDDSSR